MNQRHRARRLALQGLCCLDAQGPDAMDLVIQFVTDSREPAGTIELAEKMLAGSYACLTASDEMLTKHTRDWNLQRLALVDRNILRLGTWELLTHQSPSKVAIVEAIRLAKEFSTAESPRFINGVLDAVAKDISHKSPSQDQPVEDSVPQSDPSDEQEVSSSDEMLP